eukprot:Pgem_evm1s7215
MLFNERDSLGKTCLLEHKNKLKDFEASVDAVDVEQFSTLSDPTKEECEKVKTDISELSKLFEEHADKWNHMYK